MPSEQQSTSRGGRFNEAVDAFVERFTASIDFDKRLWRHDIAGSIAHASMLAEIGVLTADERKAIEDGLNRIAGEIERGEFIWRIQDEDVHMNIEKRLTALIGEAGKKLHTGRSRNDQVATDIRLWLRDEIDQILKELTRLQQGLLNQAEAEAETSSPATASACSIAAAGSIACRWAAPRWPVPATRLTAKSPAACWALRRFVATPWMP